MLEAAQKVGEEPGRAANVKAMIARPSPILKGRVRKKIGTRGTDRPTMAVATSVMMRRREPGAAARVANTNKDACRPTRGEHAGDEEDQERVLVLLRRWLTVALRGLLGLQGICFGYRPSPGREG